MRFTKITSRLIWALLVFGAIISVSAFARSYWIWLEELCGFTGPGCSHADLYELLGIPIALWGLGFYLSAAAINYWARSWISDWVMIGAGVELALIYVMVANRFVCLFCLINASVICLLVVLHLNRLQGWKSIAICLIGYALMSFLLEIENPDANLLYAPINGEAVVAKVNDRTITLTDLESEIATPLSKMREEIYRLKRSQLEELIRRILSEHPASLHTGVGDSQPVSEDGTTEETFQKAGRILKELQRNQPEIDRYLERPALPFTQIRIGDSPSMGPADAKLTVITFFDYRCPMCKIAHAVFRELKTSYMDDVRWVFKDYPSRSHVGADKLAEAAHCAKEQGRYWEFQDAIFASEKKTDPATSAQLAGTLGLNVEAFTQCFESGRYAPVVQNDIAEARRAGVTETPSFIINGRLFVGVMSPENFKKHIDEALRR